MNEQKQQYACTTHPFQVYGGAIDADKVSKYINDYAKENGVRLINVVTNGAQLLFFWAQK